MTAFDYNTQKWVTGPEAKTLRAEQLKQEIALLESARGSEYLVFLGLGTTETLPSAIAKARALLAECEREPEPITADNLRSERAWLLQHGMREKTTVGGRSFLAAGRELEKEVEQLTQEINRMEGGS